MSLSSAVIYYLPLEAFLTPPSPHPQSPPNWVRKPPSTRGGGGAWSPGLSPIVASTKPFRTVIWICVGHRVRTDERTNLDFPNIFSIKYQGEVREVEGGDKCGFRDDVCSLVRAPLSAAERETGSGQTHSRDHRLPPGNHTLGETFCSLKQRRKKKKSGNTGSLELLLMELDQALWLCPTPRPPVTKQKGREGRGAHHCLPSPSSCHLPIVCSLRGPYLASSLHLQQ